MSENDAAINTRIDGLDTRMSETDTAINTRIDGLDTRMSENDAAINTRIDGLTADDIDDGPNEKRFIMNDVYKRDLSVLGTLTTSNIDVVNKLHIGNSTYNDENIIVSLFSSNSFRTLYRFYDNKYIDKKSGFETAFNYTYNDSNIYWGQIGNPYNTGKLSIVSASSHSEISLSFWCKYRYPLDISSSQYSSVTVVATGFNNGNRLWRILFVLDSASNRSIIVQYLDAPYDKTSSLQTKTTYIMGPNDSFENLNFWTFNLTNSRIEIFQNGIIQHISTFSTQPFITTEAYMEEKGVETFINFNQNWQRFLYKDIAYFSKALQHTEVSLIYKYLSNAIVDSVKVYGKIRCDSIDTKGIYKDGVLLSYNSKAVFQGPVDTDKITVQNKDTRRSLSIDMIEVNSTSNLVNNSASSGYIYYADSNLETIPQIRLISYQHLTDVPSTFEPSFHTHNIEDITGLTSSIEHTSNILQGQIDLRTTKAYVQESLSTTSNILQNSINNFAILSDSIWTNTGKYIYYSNIYVYANEVRSKNPAYIDTNPYIRYTFDTQELLTIDESLNSLDIIQNNGGEYRFNENKNSLYLQGASYAKIPYINWYALSYFTIAGWFKIDTKEVENVLLDFVYESDYYINNHTSNLLFWYKFNESDYVDFINYGILGSTYNLINPVQNAASYNAPSYLASILDFNVRNDNKGPFIQFITNPNYDNNYEYDEEYRQNAGITRLDMLLHTANYDFTNMKNFTISFMYIATSSSDSFQTILDINSKLNINLEIIQGIFTINANLFTTYRVSILNVPVTLNQLNHYTFVIKSLKTYVEFKFYLNAVLFYEWTLLLANFNPSPGNIIINYTQGNLKCEGYLGDFRIYNRCLALIEIEQILQTFNSDIMDIFRPNIKISNKIINAQPKLCFEANMQEVYNSPYIDNSWVHIIWNTQEGYIKINNQIVYSNYINIIPVIYGNYLGNIANGGDIYISDFHILNKTISAVIETQLFNSVVEYYKFVDDIFFKSYIANALPAEVNDYIVSQNIIGTLTAYSDSTSNSIIQYIQQTSNTITLAYTSYVEQTSNQIILNYIEYDKISSNNLIEHITNTSNTITSNYIQYANIIAENLVTTSNSLVGQIHTASNNLIDYIDKVALELISIELSGSSSDLYDYIDTSVARSFANIDQVWERNGGSIYYQNGPVLIGQSEQNQQSIPNTNLDVAGNAVIRNDLHIFGSSSNYGQLFVGGQTNSLDNSAIVQGKLRCDTLSLDYIDKDGESVPLNSTKLYTESMQTGKITLQYDGDRRQFAIDTTVLNSVRNLVNDTGSQGYLRFINPGISTICQVNRISFNELDDRPIIFSGNYADLNDIPTSFNPSAHTHAMSNITGLSEAFVNTSNYAYQLSSNLQENISNKWKIDSSCNLYYTTGKIGIGTSSFVDGAILNVKGNVTLLDQTILGNAAFTDETTINTMFNDMSLLCRHYVKPGFVRNIITSTHYNYPNTIQGIDGKTWGRITYNSGSFDIISNSLVSSSANISLYIYLPVALTFPVINNTEYTCIIAVGTGVSESFRILLANGVYNNVTKTRVHIQYFIKTYLDGFLQSQSWNTKLSYELAANELLTVPNHFAFNITDSSAKIYMNGNLKASASFSSDGIYNFGISNVQLVSYGDIQNIAFQQPHQNFAWKDAWFFNRILTDNEVRVLYKFLNNTINETLKVYGKIMCDSIDAKLIYKNNEPLVYNKKDLFEGTKEIGKITVQNRGTRRSLSIDAIEVNSTSNIINNSGRTGYLYYSDANQETLAQIKVIAYNELAQIPSTFAPSHHTHLVADISGLSQSFIDTSNYVRAESNFLRGLINDKETTFTVTSNRALVSDANGKVTASTITSNQLGYLSDVTGKIGAALSGKENTISLISNRALVSDANGKLAVSSITSNQLGYLTGLTQNISTSLSGKENTIGVLPVSKGGTSISAISPNQLLGSGSSANTIQAITVSTGLSLIGGVLTATGSGTTSSSASSSAQYWTSNAGYISYNNVHVFPNEIRINTPTQVSLDSYLYYEFKSSSDLLVDSSKNTRALMNNGGTYSLSDNKNSILFIPTKYANISNQDWSVFSDLTISGWFKKSSLATNDIIYNFSFLPASFFNNTTNLQAWYKFDSNMLIDSTGKGYTLVNNNATFSSALFKTASGSIQFNLDLQQYATLPSSFNLYSIWTNAVFGITISFWFKINTNPDKREALIFSIVSTDIIIDITLVKTISNTNVYSVKLNVAYVSGSAPSTYSIGNVSVSQWHHIILSIYKTGTLMMHLDNVHYNPVINNVRFINSAYVISVGQMQGYQNSDYDYVTLNIDDFRFYNTILTVWQIYELYYFTIQTQNIKLTQNYDNLLFEINSTPVVSCSLNYSWNHIIWNVTNSTSDKGFVKINNETKLLFDKITLYPGNYSNTLGSNINQGSIYISDFRILTTPVTTSIENILYTSQYVPVYTTLVDDLYVSSTSNNIIKYFDTTYKNSKTTSNLVNNTGSKGYLYYSNTNLSTIAQVKSISYNELTDKPETPNNVWSTNLLKIYTTSTAVGIGTNNPAYILDIQGPKPILRLLDNSVDISGLSGDITFAGISLHKANPSTGYDLIYSRDDRFYIKGFNGTEIRYDLSIDNPTGNVGIGMQNPGEYKLNVNGNAYISGSLYAKYDIAAYYTVSDDRIKTVTGKIENALKIVNELSTFKYKTDNELAKLYGFNGQDTYLGVSAQEVQKTLPEIVKLAPFDSTYENDKQISKSGNNYMTVQYEKMVPVLIEAIKELTQKYNELEKYVKNK